MNYLAWATPVVLAGILVIYPPKHIANRLVDYYLDLKYHYFPPASLNPVEDTKYYLNHVEIITDKGSLVDVALPSPLTSLVINDAWIDKQLAVISPQNTPRLLNLHYTYDYKPFIFPYVWKPESTLTFPIYSKADLDSSMHMEYDEIEVTPSKDSIDFDVILSYAGPKGNFYSDSPYSGILLKNCWHRSVNGPVVLNNQCLVLTDMLGRTYKFHDSDPLTFGDDNGN